MQIQQTPASLLATIDDPTANGDTTQSLDETPAWNSQAAPDSIRRGPLPPSWPSAGGACGGLSAILSQLMNLLQQLIGALGGSGSSGPGPQQPFFNSAQASSSGDPHLAFNGSTATGTQQAHFDSMSDHADLLDSNSFRGGFRIGTSVTQPGANGVTWNRQAAVTTDYGATQVSLDNQGDATVNRNGSAVALAPGQSLQLNRHENVTRNADGSLVISDQNNSGGNITTTFRQNGQGVDVSVNAGGVDLGGDLVSSTVGRRPL